MSDLPKDLPKIVARAIRQVERWIADPGYEPRLERTLERLDARAELWTFVGCLEKRLAALAARPGVDPMESVEGRVLELVIADAYLLEGNPGPMVLLLEADYLDYEGSVAPLVELLLEIGALREASMYLEHAEECGLAEGDDELVALRQRCDHEVSADGPTSFSLCPELRLRADTATH